MASAFFKRLADKYGSRKVSGKKYRKIIDSILVNNTLKMGRAIARLTESNYQAEVKRLSKTRKGTVKLPNLSSVIPKRSVFLIKSAESGAWISSTLREQLERDLRSTLKEFDGTGQNRMEMQRGRATGKINPELVESFQRKIRKTFESRTKRDPKTGVPPNVKNIAVTEIRTTVNGIKEAYKDELLRKNPNLRATKTWLHNRSLSKKPRTPHMKLHNKTIPSEEMFEVERDDGGVDLMSRPHDPDAPEDQVIGCNCDIVYKVQFLD